MTDAERSRLCNLAGDQLIELVAGWERLGIPPEGMFGILAAQLTKAGCDMGLTITGIMMEFGVCLSSFQRLAEEQERQQREN